MCLLHLYNLSNIKNHDYIPLLSWLTIIIYNMSTNYVKKNSTPIKSWVINSAQSWNRTSDTRIFSPLLYQLSYLGLHKSSGDRIWTYDLRVMSPTSFQTAPPRGKKIKWAEMDSNHRSITQQIYSLSPLATRESTHFSLLATSCFKQKADDRTRTDNLLITNQLLCQLSHIGILNCQMTPTGFEPVLPPWKGDVLTAWPWGQVFKISSPSRARTYNPSVNSRVLYHWAIEEYHLVNHGVFVNVITFDLKMQVFFYLYLQNFTQKVSNLTPSINQW